MATRPEGRPPSPTALASPEGKGTAVPPPGAPRERNEPLRPELVAEQLARAAENEQTLQPLRFETRASVPVVPEPRPVSLKPSDAVKDTDPALSSVAEALAESLASRGLKVDPAAETAALDAGEDMATGPGGEADARSADAGGGLDAVRRDLGIPRRPAESDTDSPSRGIPHPSMDPGKQVTGGFGVGAQEYFALDGSEVRVLAERLVGRLLKKLQADLRMTLAITYPQVRIRAAILIDGATADAGVNDVAFDLLEAEVLHLEAIVTDDPDSPPDALRDEAGLDRPYKRVVQMGAGRTLADRVVR